jgi:quinoprotein glucose dehydrogenase
MGTLDARLVALDADTGKLCPDFGANGQVDLTRGIDLRDLGNYQMTSAPAVAGDVVIVGSSIGDNRAVDVERGIVRAFDARSGALRWSWDPIPWASRTTPRTGAGNAWSTLSVDPERGLVFVPTGSASPDYWGGARKGDNRWANPSSPCARPPGSSCGASRSFITTSGTTSFITTSGTTTSRLRRGDRP